MKAKAYQFHEHAYGLAVPVPYRDQAVVDTWFDTVDPIKLFIAPLRRWELADYPGRLSFTRTLRAARRTTGTHPGFSPSGAG